MNPITEFGVNNLAYRGIDVEKVIKQPKGLPDLIKLMLTGEFETGFDAKHVIIPSIVAAWLDHGEAPPSTQNVRNCASVGVGFPVALASALMTFGEHHAAVEHAAQLLVRMVEKEGSPELLDQLLNQMRIIPGFGHPLHTKDPRIQPLAEMAGGLSVLGKHWKAACYAQTYLHARRKVEAKLNLAGLTAALWLDLGYTVETVALVPILGRTIGLAAHYKEQLAEPKFRGTPPK